MAVEITGTAFCDKNTWYNGNQTGYAPSMINDGVPGTRWIGVAVSAVTSLQNFCGIKFAELKDITEVNVNIASWGRNFSIGTWHPSKDPASATFTKADIIPIAAVDVVLTPTDADGVAIGVNKNLRFSATAQACPGVLFYCDDNTVSVLSNTPGSSNTNESMNEVRVFGGASTGDTWAKQNGTAICSSQYNDFGLVGAVNDGNTATGWSGGGVGAGAVSDWVAIQFPGVIKPRKVEVFIYSWGKTIVLGYANAAPTSKASFTVVRTIDVTVTPNDDLGIPWGRQKVNTILLPASTPDGLIWGVYTNDSGANILGASGGAVDRIRMMELSIYGAIQSVSDGVNPKPPPLVPVLPFSATPASWTRTEFSSVGTFNFTPAAETTLLLAVAVGAGSGGRVILDMNGNRTPDDSTLFGGDTKIGNSSAVFLNAPGGKANLGQPATFPGALTQEDWLRCVDSGFTNTNINTTLIGALAGAASAIAGTAGAAYTMAANNTNDGLTTFTAFNGNGALPASIVPVYDGFTRNSTYGFLSANTTVGSTGTVTFQMKVVNGQRFSFNVGMTSGTGGQTYNNLSLEIDGVQVNTITSDGNSTYTFAGFFATDGIVTLKFLFKRNSAPASPSQGYVQSLTLNNVNIPGGVPGASGDTAQVYLVPKPLVITVGAGGLPQTGGQTVAAAQDGKRGSGGAPGGKGGDGVVVIYEFKSSVVFETPILPLFPNYNNLTPELAGVYRTNYYGTGISTKQTYTHKLRPRTKRVFAIVVGAGGGSVPVVAAPDIIYRNDPAILTAGTATITAGSGTSSYRHYSSSYLGSEPGEIGRVETEKDLIFSQDGVANTNYYANVTSVAGNFGNSAAGYNDNSGNITRLSHAGASGAVAMVMFSEAELASRTIDIQVPGGGYGALAVGQPGAVFIFETESLFGAYITQDAELILIKSGATGSQVTQVAELVLQKNKIATTQVTQTAEMVLQKSAIAATTVTQLAEMVLVKDSTEVDLQVGNIYASVVFDAGPTAIVTTQTSEMVLQKSAKAATAITHVAEMVLQKTVRSPYRATQVSELFLVAETPTIFWLNFGILENPMRFQLYDSAIGRASSVPPNCKIQVEGFFAPGTQMFINGVASGTLADVKNNDRVYLNGGVTNYWQTSIPVYAYYEQNGETARMLVGNWTIKQPELVPLITKAYYGSKTTPTWIKTRAGVGSMGTLQSIITKALMSLVQLTMTAVQNKFGSLVDLLQEKTSANSRIAEVTMGWDITKALSKVSETVTWSYTQALSIDVKNVVTWCTQKAQTAEFKQADFIDTKALYGDVDTEWAVRTDGSTGYVLTGESVLLSVNYAHFESGTEQTQAAYGDYTVEEFVKDSVAYDEVDQEYEYNNVDHSVTYEVVYVAVQSSSRARLFDMVPMDTTAYSVLTGMEWERSTAQGTGNWKIPTFDALNPQAKFGVFSVEGVDAPKAHSEYSERGTEAINGPQQGYFDTTSLWMQTYSVYAERSATIKHTEKVEVFDVTPIKTTAKTGVFNLTPFRAAQTPNGIGKASLYKGFDTKAEVDQFTENFSGVHTSLKYNGYVYTLDVDKSFICEIFNNGPVKWLLQGG